MTDLGYKHDHIIDLIKKKLANNNIFHALLIYGESGSGKTFLSNEISKILLNCNADMGKNSASTKSPDLYILEKDISQNSNIITVGEIRKIKEWIGFTSVKSKYKVLIINDADRMNINASNAFLKILEEPIGNAIIILNTSKIGALPFTLKSRCIKMKLRKKSMEEFIKILSDKFPSKINAESKGLYKLCNGNINLATYIIENDHLNFPIQLDSEENYNEILEYMFQLNLEDSNNFKIFIHLMDYFYSKIVDAKINHNQQLNNDFFSNVDKIENILSNIYHLNKIHSKELIINILKECTCI